MSTETMSPRPSDSVFVRFFYRSWLGTMWRYRELTLAMAYREITDRYAGQMLGALWAIGHPLLLISIYITVFAFVLNIKTGMDTRGDYLLYMLSGIIPWMALQDAMLRSAFVIVVHTGLVKQVAFPLEVLPVKTIMAALLGQVISTFLLAGYAVWAYGVPPATWCLWPLLFVVQFVGLLGLGYFFSAVGVFFRDLKDVLTVFCTGSLYCLPIFYKLEQLPDWARVVILCNPFTHLLFCYQDIFFYQEVRHVWSWVGVGSASFALFFVGKKLFSRTRSMFGNVL